MEERAAPVAGAASARDTSTLWQDGRFGGGVVSDMARNYRVQQELHNGFARLLIGDSGFIDRWLVEKGEKVIAGQILVLVETSKGNFKITAPISGVVIEILLKNKSSISENELISIIYSLDN